MDSLNLRERAATSVGVVVEYIEQRIADGTWGSGTQLPTERELEKRFGVSRSTLRKTLRLLEQQGKITRHVGRGTFVADVPKPAELVIPKSEDLVQLIFGSSPAEVMEVRLMIEPLAAEAAAGRANAEDLRQLDECLVRLDQAADVAEFEHWDGMLHVTIISAAKNNLLTNIYEAINDIRNQPQWRKIKERTVTLERRALYQTQHRAIVTALHDRDAHKARTALREHLIQVRSSLLEPSPGD
jgi:DNA-binding FadR family transcriptional regulator